METIPTLIAHRGYTRHYPENTLIGIEAAIKAGARFIEIDVQLSRDQVPVLFHDRELERMCGMKGQVHQSSFAQLRSLHASEFGRFGYKFAHEPLASLAEFCDLLGRHPEVTAFVELKRASIEHFGVTTVLKQVSQEIMPLARQCVLISYSFHALHAARKQGGIRIGAVLETWRQRWQRAVRSLKPEYLFCDVDDLPRWGKLRAGSSQIAVFEIIDPALAVRLARRGVTFIETFAVGEMLEQLEIHRASKL